MFPRNKQMKTIQRVEEQKVSINPSADGVYLFAT